MQICEYFSAELTPARFILKGDDVRFNVQESSEKYAACMIYNTQIILNLAQKGNVVKTVT